jgi:hypothetical protein
VPSFRVTDDVAYSTGIGTEDDPVNAGIPWFTILGSMVYRAEGHPLGKSDSPRYQSRG